MKCIARQTAVKSYYYTHKAVLHISSLLLLGMNAQLVSSKVGNIGPT